MGLSDPARDLPAVPQSSTILSEMIQISRTPVLGSHVQSSRACKAGP